MFFYILIFYMLMIYIFMFFIFMYFYINQFVYFLELELINLFSMKIEFLILIDWISLLFSSVVIMISFLVVIYSMEYMMDDINIKRFIYLIMLFVFSMLMMIYSPNLISLLFGWDGLGLISYCLVIYYQNKVSFNSGMVTVLINRLGDILIMLSIGLMMSLGSWNLLYLDNFSSLIYLMLILASFTKSAQIPFSSWLPLAMAAPTPVSSLVHSSTLVTAGVYLLIRLNYLLINKDLINYMMLVSMLTMFMSGLGASFEFDLKKIIALSTLSQLGVMIFSLSINYGLVKISMFHLLIHAMFKSMLFLCAGVIIHNLGVQDIRLIKMLLMNYPLMSIFFNCSFLSLCGLPFLSGFFSKDLILELYLMSMFNKFILYMVFMSMGFTVLYTFRLIYYSFINLNNINQLMINLSYGEIGSGMSVSMYMLFMMSIIKGVILNWVLMSMKNLIYLNLKLKMLIFFFMGLGIFMGVIFMYYFNGIFFLMIMNLMMKYFSLLWFLGLFSSYSVLNLMIFSKMNLLDKLENTWGEYINSLMILMSMIKLFKFDYFFKLVLKLLFIFMIMIILLNF